MGKVVYGLKNVHYAVFNEETKTYGEWKRIPGAVNLTADAEVNQNDFYADDIVYATINSSSKETGSIEFAALTKEIEQDLLGYKEDATSGLSYISTEPKNTTVALGYEVAGNENKQRGVRYNVKFTPPTQNANTMTDSTDPDTVTMDYTAIGRDFTIDEETVNVLKAHVDESETSDAYKSFFESVIVPGAAPVTPSA